MSVQYLEPAEWQKGRASSPAVISDGGRIVCGAALLAFRI